MGSMRAHISTGHRFLKATSYALYTDTTVLRCRMHRRAMQVWAASTVPDTSAMQPMASRPWSRSVMVPLAAVLATASLTMVAFGVATAGVACVNWLYPGGMAFAAFDLWVKANPVPAELINLGLQVLCTTFGLVWINRACQWAIDATEPARQAARQAKMQEMMAMAPRDAAATYCMSALTDEVLDALHDMRLDTMEWLVGAVQFSPDAFRQGLVDRGVYIFDATQLMLQVQAFDERVQTIV